ncbi:hypothetical protein [Nocardioides baculatus]|uniref:Uncharacterized protein n=1 Tax=Nocardioides baculatus TaxID=2801337 RepID=A0ABS1LD05_9ACTN|nr:hypothetical protein [Nocardioides baculatus]MBL0748807.1 hypothetical protein [Nocardioides baculatus]
MGPVQLLLLAIVAAGLLLATNRWAKQQRSELEKLEPPPSLDSVPTWEDEVLAAQMAADRAEAEAASTPDSALDSARAAEPPSEQPPESPEQPPGAAERPPY